MNNIFLYKRFIGVKKINGHSGVNFSFKYKLLDAVSRIKEYHSDYNYQKFTRTAIPKTTKQKLVKLQQLVRTSFHVVKKFVIVHRG